MTKSRELVEGALETLKLVDEDDFALVHMVVNKDFNAGIITPDDSKYYKEQSDLIVDARESDTP